MLRDLLFLSWILILLNQLIAQSEIKQTALIGDEAVVEWNLQISAAQDFCVSFEANGQLEGFNVTLFFQNQGSDESWPSDMDILMRLLNNETGLIEACYQWGGFDYGVNK